MMKGVFAWMLGLWVAMLTAALAHPHNSSIGTADWIADSKSLEVALKVSIDDLEDLLSTDKKEVRLGNANDKPAENALKAYILQHVAIGTTKGQTVPVEWIGYEVEESDTWIYLQFTFPTATMKDCRLTNTILVAENDQQVNFINVKKGKRHKTLKFNKRRTRLKLPSF